MTKRMKRGDGTIVVYPIIPWTGDGPAMMAAAAAKAAQKWEVVEVMEVEQCSPTSAQPTEAPKPAIPMPGAVETPLSPAQKAWVTRRANAEASA